MYCHIRDTDDIDSLQLSINKFVDWTEKWQVKLNTDKCKVISSFDPSPKIFRVFLGYRGLSGLLPSSPWWWWLSELNFFGIVNFRIANCYWFSQYECGRSGRMGRQFLFRQALFRQALFRQALFRQFLFRHVVTFHDGVKLSALYLVTRQSPAASWSKKRSEWFGRILAPLYAMRMTMLPATRLLK